MRPMDKESPSSITEFDALYTTNQIQILKILLPFISPGMQKSIAVYIKLMELKLALDKSHSSHFVPFSPKPFWGNIEPIYEEIEPFLAQKERESLSQIKETFKSFQDMKDTMEMFQMMQETMSEEEMSEFMKNGMGLF